MNGDILISKFYMDSAQLTEVKRVPTIKKIKAPCEWKFCVLKMKEAMSTKYL